MMLNKGWFKDINLQICEIWSSYGGEDVSVLGCDSVWTCRYILKFWRNILSLSSALLLEKNIPSPSSALKIGGSRFLQIVCIYLSSPYSIMNQKKTSRHPPNMSVVPSLSFHTWIISTVSHVGESFKSYLWLVIQNYSGYSLYSLF
jgi:hypothetical protein